MDKKTLQNILSKPFELTDWQNLLTELFGVKSFLQKPAIVPLSNNKKAEAAFELGNFSTSDDRIIGLYLVKVKPEVWLERNKVGLRELLRSVYRHDVDGALIVFEQDDKWRLSFVSEIRIFDEQGNAIESKTQPKRFTYLLGKGQKVKTPTDRLYAIAGKKINLEDIRNLFSVSTLTKEFYNELFKWYEWALSEEVGITFPRNTNIPSDNREKLEEQIIRLITRLLFVWFIKQKDLVPHDLFDTSKLQKTLKDFKPNDSQNGIYYNAILQNLFFATLNKAITERAFAKEENNRDIKTLYRYAEMFSINEKEVLELFKPIPFLNGGLFECLDKDTAMDGIKYHLDGFSRNGKKVKGQYSHRAFIPNCVFFDEQKGIIPLLERYNFTVEENVPEDVQVALDPELLGNVFENLLGAFNNETKESARKQSGSFYTPREIVDFMVSESLQAYLQQHIGEVDLDGKLTDARKKTIYDTLLKVKILDPACGSGAFPMGILNGIITILEKIGVAEALDMYKLKLHLIENCVYGVDLQTIAAQISKLRFFISLIVEQKEKDLRKENYGVITLPNLETKFVAANTLLGLHKKQAQGNLFEDPRIETTKQEILAVRHEHFYAKTAKDKKQLREKDAQLRSELVKLLEHNHEFAPEDAKQVAVWNPYDQNASSPFFDTEWMFGVKDGFDIVIGNPPYVGLSKNNGALAKIYQNYGYDTFEKSGDIYSIFYEKGWHLLKPKGVLCFITSNGWMRNDHGESTRRFFAERTNPILLIDFAGQKIFDTATVEVNILMFQRDKNQQKTLACIVKEAVLNKLSVFVKQTAVESSFTTSESWVILSPIEQRIKTKIEAMGTPLKDWEINIYRGVLTGYNEAFIINSNKKAELMAEDPKSAEIIRPILRGRDIKRYGYEFADLWLINTHNGIKRSGVKPININDYPAIKRWLDYGGIAYNGKIYEGYKQIEKRADQGDTPYNLRNCVYMEDFSKQKIVWGNLNLKASYAIAPGELFVNAPCPMIVPASKYLLSVLNSKLADFYIRTLAKKRGGGYIEYKPTFIERLPVPIISDDRQKQFASLVEIRNNTSRDNCSNASIEKDINELIYELYNLTKEEIDVIELQ
ncbi:Eco57I restriction-modification methylase domain-containing protein [Hufsiella ginkgonis]|uniref:site-specific DNA-methyltransferase (adenine-specific) n=1 Tax=Hufsiella ginkgonis TaxID=2695274 RepID=A0A7K1XTB6_9SPHI|nr:N-6 DNA methylase [Hufsiella ginkgonis]MXV14019.1 N-6 DNA methylase [Hufsiella ginkgonis]